MAEFEEKDFIKLTKLARIECSEAERKKLFSSVKNILSYVQQLNAVNVEGVNPCNHVLETISNVMRDDVVGPTLSREVFLSNAPVHVGGMVRVPPVMKADDASQ